MALDLSKPVQTTAGEPVELISTTLRGDHPIGGYIGARSQLWCWRAIEVPASPGFEHRAGPWASKPGN